MARNYRKLRSSLFSACCLVLLSSTIGSAQRSDLFPRLSLTDKSPVTATLTGIVVDENEAVVPGASVFVSGINGSVKRGATTGREGHFEIFQLPPGNYNVAVQHHGFATAEVRDVTLRTRDQIALKIQLKPGNIGETVTVVSDDSIIQRTPGIGLSINGLSIEQLPLNGRSLQSTITLTPGALPTKSTFTEQGQFSVNGQRANANYFSVDGVSANIGVAAGADGLGQSGGGSLPGLSALGTTHSLVSLEGVQEFNIQSHGYAPEFGRTPGAQVLITSRSGTAAFHGTLFDYFRTGALAANDWFANRDGLSTRRLRQHNFGGVLGGPLIKDRTFFFISYEGLRLRLPQIATTEVPSMLARHSAAPQLQPFLNVFPVPNGPDTSNGFAKFTSSYSDSANLNTASIRVDQRIGRKHTLFARFHTAPSTLVQRGVGNSLNTSLVMGFSTQTLTFGANTALTSQITNEFRANYSKSRGSKLSRLDGFGGGTPIEASMLFPPSTSSQDSSYSLSFGGNASFAVGKDATNFQHQINLVNNVSVFANSHRMKFGVDYRRLSPVYGERKYKEISSFNGLTAAIENPIASSVTLLTQDEVGIVFTNFSAYAQDAWKVSRRLNVTYGLRWELNPAPSGKNGQQPFSVQGLNNPAALSLAPTGTPYYQTTLNNFAPRLGVAYHVWGESGRETIVRAGFGLFYDLGSGALANATVSFPYLRRRVLSNVEYPVTPRLVPLDFTLNPPVSRIRVADPNLRLPRTIQWNVALEQSLGSNQSVSATYVAALGRRLLRLESISNPNPDFSQILVTTNNATSDYHALQVNFQRRLSRGLQTFAAYTWSHSIDTASNDSTANAPKAKIDPQLERGSSDFDIRHSFTGAISYALPSPTKQLWVSSLLRNWSVDAIVAARSATPVDVFVRRDIGFGPFNLRPDVVPGIPFYIEDATAPGGRRIDSDAFVTPKAARQGTLGRNVLRGFAFSQLDLALRRRFALREQMNLELRADVFNVLNHPNFGDPVADMGSSFFGRSTSMLGRSMGSTGSVGLNPLYQIGGPRTIQLALKLQF